MYGPTVDKARPVAFDSAQFSGAELNYPAHEKELLAIVGCLQKWRADCLGMKIYVLTDHKTLENFETQRDLSRRQLRWQEELSQFDLDIAYIRGEDNPAADALSRIRLGALPSDHIPRTEVDDDPIDPPNIAAWKSNPFTCASVLSVTADKVFHDNVVKGYLNDRLVHKIINGGSLVPGVER